MTNLKLGIGIVVAGLTGATAAAFDLPSYEASYELRLVRASAGEGPRAATGAFDSRFVETCDGWEVKSHIILDLTFRDDRTFTNERFFTSWESKSGADYRFAAQTVKNGVTVEAFKGTAKVTRTGGQAMYEPLGTGTGEKKYFIALPRGTLLPAAQSRALLAHAEQGESIFRSTVMSGASSSGPLVISTIIGPRLMGNKDEAAADDSQTLDPELLKAPAWLMSTAYFNLNENRETPNTEMLLQLNDAGVTRTFEQSFDDFAISARLIKLRRVERPPCG